MAEEVRFAGLRICINADQVMLLQGAMQEAGTDEIIALAQSCKVKGAGIFVHNVMFPPQICSGASVKVADDFPQFMEGLSKEVRSSLNVWIHSHPFASTHWWSSVDTTQTSRMAEEYPYTLGLLLTQGGITCVYQEACGIQIDAVPVRVLYEDKEAMAAGAALWKGAKRAEVVKARAFKGFSTRGGQWWEQDDKLLKRQFLACDIEKLPCFADKCLGFDCKFWLVCWPDDAPERRIRTRTDRLLAARVLEMDGVQTESEVDDGRML